MDQTKPTRTDEGYRSPSYRERYKKHYAEAKAKGEAFFPYVIYQDAIVSFIVFVIILALSLLEGAPLEAKADPTDLLVVPRPEWYFLFLFQLLKLVPSNLESLIGVALPGIALAFLFFMPIFDRNPRRNPRGRSFAIAGGLFVAVALVVLTIEGALSQPPSITATSEPQLSPQAQAGRQVYLNNGCSACHKIGGTGGQIGPDLTHIGSQLDAQTMKDFITNPKAKAPDTVMPSFSNLSQDDLDSLVVYLSSLK